MKIDFIKNEGILILKPQRKYKGGYDLEVSLNDDFVCFSILQNGTGSNVQIDYSEFHQLVEILNNIKVE